MLNRLPIRIKPKDGESLSSFISRLAFRNALHYLDIIKLISKNESTLKVRKILHMDIAPELNINLSKLSELCGIEENKLEELTFLPVTKKFLKNYKLNYRRNLFFILNSLEVSKKKYCIECLKEHSGYKLLWQVKDVKLCDKHLIPFEEKFMEPNKFLDINLVDEIYIYTKNKEQNNNLEGNIEIDIKKQKEVYDMWHFFQKSEGSLHIRENINFDIYVSIILLYIGQAGDKKLFDVNKSIYSSKKINRLKNIINNGNNNGNLSINSINEYLKVANYSFENFFSTYIPDEFIKLCLYKDKKL